MEWKQRELKFKFWDKRHNRVEGEVLIDSDGGISHEHGNGGSTAYGIIPLQYTGLKDKNGTEIYEGDVARDASGTVAVIEYRPPMFCAMVKGKPWDINTKGSPNERVRCIEVIGNIFENPELLG